MIQLLFCKVCKKITPHECYRTGEVCTVCKQVRVVTSRDIHREVNDDMALPEE